MIDISRRDLIVGAVMIGASMPISAGRAQAAERRFDFTKPVDGWEMVTGMWTIEDMADARGGRALVQHATENEFNVVVAPGGPYGDVDVAVRFKPISGREDASGGIVFRFADGHYYVIRANALEGNFRFYYYDRGRHQIDSASVKTPMLGQWHRLHIRAEGDRIQGWLDDQALLDRRDKRYSTGRIGLWTKANSVTAFDDLTVTPLSDR